MRVSNQVLCLVSMMVLLIGCADDTNDFGNDNGVVDDGAEGPVTTNGSIAAVFGTRIDLTNLLNYSNQNVPNYIDQDNTAGNPITNAGATLGRVLFYDTNLSSNQNISCASCHKQENGFGDLAVTSVGVNGRTGRHSMRLINARFSDEESFFWDERAEDLEEQTTQPIQDHVEMGFSGEQGDGDINDLIDRLEGIDYYQELFTFVYGDANITENEIQRALAQFIRSIQSFDSKYDIGRANTNNELANFNNFTDLENLGKSLFIRDAQFQNGNRIGGGIGCGDCHRAPEFDIRPNSRNNGAIAAIGGGTDLDITRSPTLRDLVNDAGQLNGPMMHNGAFSTLEAVLDHYDDGIVDNQNLDNRLRPQGQVQNLNMTQAEKDAVVAFMNTLSGSDVYDDVRWSDPF